MSGRPRPGRRRGDRGRRADLSQHFLRDVRAGRLIARIPISPSDLVVEIGAGRGALTRPLARRARRLIAVELDAHLAAALRQSMGHGVEVVHADFLTWPLPDEAFRVVGNLPYAITTDIVRKLTGARNPPGDAWLIVQREVAHRLCGRPYTTESLRSLALKPHWHVEIVDRLGRTDFDPPPRVDSALLWMSHRQRPILSAAEMAVYLDLVDSAFRNAPTMDRTLRRRLSKLQLRRLAADLRFGLDAAPASLAFEQWLGIVRFLSR